MRAVATGHHIMVERQGKAPLDSGESTRATSDDVSLGDLSVSVSRLRTYNLTRGHIDMFAGADNRRIDFVAIGRGPFTVPVPPDAVSVRRVVDEN
jgi:hypothetical protein